MTYTLHSVHKEDLQVGVLLYEKYKNTKGVEIPVWFIIVSVDENDDFIEFYSTDNNMIKKTTKHAFLSNEPYCLTVEPLQVIHASH